MHCDADTRAPHLADVLHIVGCCISLVIVARLLYVYASLRFTGDPPQCAFSVYTRAAGVIRQRLGALYGHPSHTAAAFEYEANRSITTVVTPERPLPPRRESQHVPAGKSSPLTQPRVESTILPPPPLYGTNQSAAYVTSQPHLHNQRPTAGTSLVQSSPYYDSHDHPTANRAESELLISLQGVTMGDLNRWVSRLQNPLNDGIACFVIFELLQCFFEAISAVRGLTRDTRVYHWNNSTSCAEAQLDGGFCDFSASAEQFFDGGAVGSFLCVVVCVAFPGLLRRVASQRIVFGRFISIIAVVVGVVTTALMWLVLPVQPWGSKFSASMPWCWVPNDDYSHRITAGELVALRLALGYAFPLLIIGFGIKAYFAITSAVLSAIGMRFSGQSLSFVLPRSHRAIVRRFVPQILMFVIIYGFAAGTRFFSGSQETLTAVVSLLIALLPAFNVTIWANGEGFLRAALWMGGLEDVVGDSFSQLVLDCYSVPWEHELPQPSPAAGSEISDGPPLDNVRSFAGSAVGY